MYSPLIVEQRLAKAVEFGVRYRYRSIDESIAMARRIEQLLAAGKRLPTEMKDFQRSEQILCRFDFRYWAERYGFLTRDASEGGGVGPANFWPSQERALALIAAREEENEREFSKHGFAEGIHVVWHKTRQQGATGIARLITMHRMTLWKHTRCIAASLDETKVHELYDRDHIILDNLPGFLSPRMEFDVKDSHIAFEGLRSRITYQQANQQAGVGTGQQFDVSHMTEIALWKMAERLQFDFFPAIPQARTTFVGFESTANGRGDFWHEFTENVRKKVYGYGNWIYVFTPWYINAQKNRRTPPDDWTPNALTQEHAELIEATSAEFAGYRIVPKREQLYWWETEYELNKKQGSLHIFLTNYPATPEQSFQHHQRAALPLETVEWMRTTAKIKPLPYLVLPSGHVTNEDLSVVAEGGTSALDQMFPATFAIGSAGKVLRMDLSETDDDPRGILWMREPPQRGATYCMGVDPTVGRTGWNRYARVREDAKTDNGAIEVVRIGAHGKPDVQVAEYAAPVDAFELAFVANIIGRLYAGTEDDQCKCIIEIYPGPGGMTLQQMLELGYTNHFRWEYYADMVATPTKSMGWHASPKTNRDLWVKASRHLTLKSAIVRSPWLAEEYADCRMDPVKEYAQNLNGHDDRVRAFNLALWVANSWSTNIERTQEKVRQNVQATDWANSDMMPDDIYADWNSVLDRMG